MDKTTTNQIATSAANLLRKTAFTGKYRLMRAIVPRKGEETVTISGSQVRLDLSDWIQWKVYCGLYETEETKWVTSYLKPGMTMIDAGANIGYYSAVGSRAVGQQGRVIAFEPSTYAAGRLTRLKQENSLSNVLVIAAGLSDSVGEALLHFDLDIGNHSPTMASAPTTDTAVETVPTTTLDCFAKENALSKIDLLKIDVEGYEYRVLKGAKELLSKGLIRAVLCEFNRHWLELAGTTVSELEDLLASAGFKAVAKRGIENLQNCFYIQQSS